jgi:hypothetical protein
MFITKVRTMGDWVWTILEEKAVQMVVPMKMDELRRDRILSYSDGSTVSPNFPRMKYSKNDEN